MSTDLANFSDGTPERFVPTLMSGELVEAEHLLRYWFAAGHASGRTVLDAGCGLGYGSAAMAAAGATHVHGVDVAAEVIDAARADMPPEVELTVGDVHELPYEDDTFDLVVCFEVIEHVERQPEVLDELVRVSKPGALVLVSSPNRDVYVPGNPHHLHEYRPDELRAEMESRFANVQLLRQENAAVSLLLPNESLEGVGHDSLSVQSLGKTFAIEPGKEPYVVAVASDSELPELGVAGCVSDPMDVRRWLGLFDEQRETLERQAEALRELASVRGQMLELTVALQNAEQDAAKLPGAEREIQDLNEALTHTRAALEAVKASPSWRATAPIRDVKSRLARGR